MEPTPSVLHILWEYRVRPGSIREFEEHYRGDGTWARFFRGGRGYRETQLWRDGTAPGRYMTIDVWDDLPSYRAFMEANAAQYQEIDGRCVALIDEERCLGYFEAV